MAPVGYKIDPTKHLVVDSEKALCVRWIFEQFVLGRKSMLSIADELKKVVHPKI